MKWGLRVFGIFDLLTFLIFIPSKINYLFATFNFPFPMSAKIDALWQILVLFLFLATAYFFWFKPKSGLLFSFLLIPFRVAFIYFSLDFLSFLAYGFGFEQLISGVRFQVSWVYVLFYAEAARYIYSFYAYYKLHQS